MLEHLQLDLNPAMKRDESPVDFRRLDAQTYRELFQSISDYEEVATADGANQWGLRGAFIVKDVNPGAGNYVLVTLRLYDGDNETTHVRLTPLSMVDLAETLLGFAIACANVNGEPEVVSDAVMKLLRGLLSPASFRHLRNAMIDAAREQISLC